MSHVSSRQVRTIQIARRKVEQASGGAFDDPAFRLLLRNAGVRPRGDEQPSTKELTQPGFEYVMAVLEECGYREPSGSPSHWRGRCNGMATTRQVHFLKQIAADNR